MATHDDVRTIALSFPGAYEQASYGNSPSWRTKPRMFVWIREDPDALVVWVASLEDKGALLASDPEKFFTTPHYDSHPIVLVNVASVDTTELTELIEESWWLRAPRSLTKGWTRGPEHDLP